MESTSKAPPPQPEFIEVISIREPFPDSVSFTCPECSATVFGDTPEAEGGAGHAECPACGLVYDLFRSQTTSVEVYLYPEELRPESSAEALRFLQGGPS